MNPNKKQVEVINNIEGTYIVDAGAGTGKTYTITKRYLNILEQNVKPDNVLLITFTRNAAAHMKEKVLSKVENINEILEAPILNFDSFCFKIVSKHGLNAPNILGIKDNLSNFKLLKSSVVQKRYFNKFFNQFLEINQNKYQEILSEISDKDEIYSIIEKLLSKGIYPTKNEWFLSGEEKLKGNKVEYVKRFNEINKPGLGKNKKSTNSQLLSNFNKDKQYLDLPEDYVIEKQINPELGELAFDDKRENILEFIHDIYYNYIQFMIKENVMTFSLIAMFAFLILFEDDAVRRIYSYEYVMVDEFQDTNEMQFMLILLLMKKPNLCVVGDWKQGIYGFRNATISNILEFEKKLDTYKNRLNQDKLRIPFEFEQVMTQEFNINYRSSQKILDFSEKSLVVNGKKDELTQEQIQETQENIVSLKSGFDYNSCSQIKYYEAKDRETEIKHILQKIQEIVGNKTIQYFDFQEEKYKERTIEYKDIAILSRNRTFGLDIQKKAFKYNIPAVYEGGIQLFEEEESVVLLAWLKLLLYKDKKEAWITILEKENYSYAQIKYILDTKEYPQDILEFREHLLKNKKIINYVIDEIFKRYNYNSVISNKLISVLDEVFHSTFMSISELIVFIEENIEKGETYNVELENTTNSITIQTIHGSKGLEYPIVFVVNCNQANFPMNKSESNSLTFNELVGVRSKRLFSSKYNFVFDNWKTELVNQGLFSDLDEERRLLYVAITRAMYDVYITSHKPSEFYKGLADESSEIVEETNVIPSILQESSTNEELSIISQIENKNRTVSVHDLMNFKEGQKGRGKEFGDNIHRLAFRYSQNLPMSSIKEEFKQDFENIKHFIDTQLQGAKFSSEIDCSLPLGKTMIRGIIDVVAEFENKVEIIDWKSDLVKDNLQEYSKQLSVYYHVLKEVYPQKTIRAKLFWTHSGEVEEIDPLSEEELLKLLG